MNHIFNQARFDQKADFSQVLFSGTDIDFFAEVNDKFYLMVEWKCVGTGLPTGQALGFKRHVRDLGQVKPVFHVVAHHNTLPSEPIHGDNSYVAQVFFRLPNMTRGEEYIYDGPVLPTLNEWLGDLSYEWRIQYLLQSRRAQPWEGVPKITAEEWEGRWKPLIAVDGGQHIDGPTGFFDSTRAVTEAYQFA